MRPLLSLTLLVLSLPAFAQIANTPLVGPLLATNTVEQDRIVLYDLTTDSYREISLGAGAHHVWDFSADGCRVLVTLMQGTQPAQMVSARLDGSDIREMVRFDELPAERWGVWEPDWSLDGERIAFTMIRDQNTANGIERRYHTAYVTPDDPLPQFYSVTGREFSPTWSPDSQWLAYVSYDERVAGIDVFSTAVPTLEPAAGQTPTPVSLLNEADIWVVSADAVTKYPLTTFPTGNVAHPRWSPDSGLIGFVYSPSSNNDTMWMIANQQGAIPTQLSLDWGQVLAHAWLPDSTAMVSAMRDFLDIERNTLWTIPLVGNADEARQIYLAELEIAHADYPSFSPDGRWLAVRSAYELLLVELETGANRALDTVTFGNSPAVWSPQAFVGETNCQDG